jgi:hypothetical protein
MNPTNLITSRTKQTYNSTNLMNLRSNLPEGYPFILGLCPTVFALLAVPVGRVSHLLDRLHGLFFQRP